MWQPNTKKANDAAFYHSMDMVCDHWPCEHSVPITLDKSGALSEIQRLTALLAMKDETINTLRTQLHKATTTTLDDYDSGYRAA